MARLTFRQGIVRHQTDTLGNPTFLTPNGNYVNLNVSPDFTIIAFVHGTANYLYTESVSIGNAWGPFTPPNNYWLYWNLNLVTGVVTRGSTTLEPIESPSQPSSPAVGQMWFNTVTNIWYEYNGSTFAEVVRVFAAKYTNATTLQSVSIDAPDFTGTQVGLTTSARVGSLVYDSTGKPIKTGAGNRFFTTEDAFVTGVPTGSSLRVNNIVVTGQANQPIAAYQVVQYNDFAKIGVADPYQQGLRVFGIIEEDAVTNEVVNFLVEGMIYNPDWDWPAAGASANDPVYADLNGQISLTPVIPNQLPVGVVIGIQEILFAPGLFPQVQATLTPITDHGDLDALSLLDDDHPQYHTDARGDARYLGLGGGTLTGNLIMGAATDVILPDLPVNPTDAANKRYVDQVSAGLDFKDSVHMCTTANLPGTYDNGTLGAGATLTATTPGVLPPTITDNHAHYVVGDRVLVKDQIDATENGLFEVTDTGSGENVTEVITTADTANSLDGTYFQFEEAAGGAGFYVWYDTPAGAGDPAAGGTGIQVSIPTGATALQVTNATIAAINSSPAGVIAYIDEDNTFYIVDDVTGARTPAADGTTGFTITTPIPGTATPTPWVLTRTLDADNTPTNEVSGGLFVFIEDGATCAGTGWVLTDPQGNAILGTDELLFTQFSAVPTVNPSRIQDSDNNTYVDVELTADNNNVIMQGGPRDVANLGGGVIINAGSGGVGTDFDGGDITLTSGNADQTSAVPNFGGSIYLTTGLSTAGGPSDGRSGSIELVVPDGPTESGHIRLQTGDSPELGDGSIILRPGAQGIGGVTSAGVEIEGSPTLGGSVESNLRFIPKANLASRAGVGFAPPVTVIADLIWTLPGVDGTNGQVLTTDGSGTLFWSTAAGGSVSRINDGDNDTFVETQNTLDGDNNIVMQSGISNSQNQGTTPRGNITIKSGDAEQGAEFFRLAGSITLEGGIGNVFGDGSAGSINLIGGDNTGEGASASPPGDINIYSGNQDSSDPLKLTPGGTIDIFAGDSNFGPGGPVTIQAGGGGTNGGDVTITGGEGGGVGAFTGGNVILIGGEKTAGDLTQIGQVRIDSPFGTRTELVFTPEGDAAGNAVGFKAPALTPEEETVWSLPNYDGGDGQVLVTDGNKNLAWATANITPTLVPFALLSYLNNGDGPPFYTEEGTVFAFEVIVGGTFRIGTVIQDFFNPGVAWDSDAVMSVYDQAGTAIPPDSGAFTYLDGTTIDNTFEEGPEVAEWVLTPGIYQVMTQAYNIDSKVGPVCVLVAPADGIGMIGGPGGAPTAVHTGVRYVGKIFHNDVSENISGEVPALASLPPLETDLQNRHSAGGWIDGTTDDGHLYTFEVGTPGNFLFGVGSGWVDASGAGLDKGVNVGFALYDSNGTVIFDQEIETGEYAEQQQAVLTAGTYQLHVKQPQPHAPEAGVTSSPYFVYVMDLTEGLRRSPDSGDEFASGDLSVGLIYDRQLNGALTPGAIGVAGLPDATDECTTLVSNDTGSFVERPALELPHPYDIAAQVFGEAPAGGIVLKFVAPHEITLFEYGHWGDAETPPTAGDRVFDVRKNGVSVGTILFEQNAATHGFTTDFGISQVGTAGAPAIQLAQGDVLTVVSPSDGDPQGSTGTGNAGLEDVALTLRGHVLPGSAISCITPDFTLTPPALFSTDFTISGVVGGITHYEVAVVAYGDPTETGNPLTTTFFPTSDQSTFGPNGATIDDGTTSVAVSRESEYVTLPHDTTTFDVFDDSGGSRYILVRVCGFAPGGIVCKQGLLETAGA